MMELSLAFCTGALLFGVVGLVLYKANALYKGDKVVYIDLENNSHIGTFIRHLPQRGCEIVVGKKYIMVSKKNIYKLL